MRGAHIHTIHADEEDDDEPQEESWFKKKEKRSKKSTKGKGVSITYRFIQGRQDSGRNDARGLSR